MKYSLISRRFVSDSTYQSEQEAAPYILLMALFFGFCFWIYGTFINPTIKIETEEKTVVVFSKRDYAKTTEINGISCDGFTCKRLNIQNLNIGDSIKIEIQNYYKKSGDIYKNTKIIKKIKYGIF